MEGPGLCFRGREASLVQPRVSVGTWQTGEGFSLEGISTTSFQFLLTHSEGWGARFLAAVAGFRGSPKGTTEEIFQGPNGPSV